ncbi:MAG: hypothetical protein JXJ22_08830 [Bacteroidales bacterium]|nr:hypothetical protein [Bacteroidales bacterium]
MEKFKFLIGTWDLKYNIPKSFMSIPDTGSGKGTFKRALDNKYVYFDYSGTLSTGPFSAHAVFARDKHEDLYRFWWFENSGSYETASCSFLNEDTLYINWHNGLLQQTFKKAEPGKVILHMEHPNAEGKFDLLLEVILTKEL